MKNLLLVLFIFFGMVLLISESMAAATFHGPWFFVWGALLIIAATSVIGCFDLANSDRLGWLFMVVVGALIVLASLAHGGSILKPAAGLGYALVGLMLFLKAKRSASHDHGSHAH